MRKNMIVLLLVIFFLMVSVQVFSHPASKVTLSIEGTLLRVIVNHDVGNAEDHYIKEILVFLNEKEIIRQIFYMQTGNIQDVSYTIPSLKAGDKITVSTNCSRRGNRSGMIIVEPTS